MVLLRWLELSLLVGLTVGVANPRVDLGYVQYEGVADPILNIDTFFGIRYAASPSGLLRWKAPVPIELKNNYTHAQVINATEPGPQCMQGSLSTEMELASLLGTVPGIAFALGVSSAEGNQRPSSEDCLLLDVIVPANASSSSPVPVVVNIHGGGFVYGNTQTSDGSQFASYAQGSVIWVSIQYRLGAYGFLGGRGVLATGDTNVGLLDQRAALLWVQRHISAFGGDPDSVTLWGISAGGGSVVDQLIIDRNATAPPYRAAVAESPWFQPYHDPDILEAQYTDLLSSSRCSDFACLRGLSEEALWIAANETIALGVASGLKAPGDFYWGPYVDGILIPDLPSVLLRNGEFHKVPLLVDHGTKEGLLFQNYSVVSEEEVTTELQELWPKANGYFFKRLYSLYPLAAFKGSFFSRSFFMSGFYAAFSSFIPTLAASTADAPLWQAEAVFGDAIVKCPSHNMAEALRANAKPVWKLLCSAGLYVHAASSVFVLDNLTDTGNETLAGIMRSWYLSFVVNLDPNAAGGPHWAAYGTKEDSVMVVTDNDVKMDIDGDMSAACEFFEQNFGVVRN